MDLCGPCGRLAFGTKNPDRALRGRRCPRFTTVHHACCAAEECSRIDGRGAVRCDFERWSRAR